MKQSTQLTAHQSMVKRNGINQSKIMALKTSLERGKMITEIETIRFARIIYIHEEAVTIQDGSDIVYLTIDETIQLRDFLNQLPL